MFGKHLAFFALVLFAILISASSASAEGTTVKFSAYADAYAAIDNANESSSDILLSEGLSYRSFSIVNGQRNNFGINIAQVSADVNHNNMARGKVTLHYGDIPQQTWTAAGVGYPAIQEAYAGIMVLENLWVDAGYFLTHIGGESLLPKDNWLSSHSMVTFYEPFYQSGLRFSYEADKLTAQLHVLNGNNIFEDNNVNKTVGLYLGYQISDQFSASYANVIGNEVPGNPQNAQTHMYHNICLNFDMNEQFQTKAQIDLASLGENEAGTIDSKSFMGFSVQGRYAFTTKYAATLRFAYIDDKDGIYGANNYESLMGITAGFEYKPTNFSYFRLEGRMLSADTETFDFDEATMLPTEKSRMELMLNMGVWID
jgi:hypothetical protein